MTSTPRLALPLLTAGQAQKEITHNEALLLLDMLVATVASAPSNQPPASPVSGIVQICGTNPLDVWSGHANELAMFTEGGWRFCRPFEGMRIVDAATGQDWRYRSSAWECGTILATQVMIEGERVVGAQTSAIREPSGGSIVDVQARTALAAVLESMRAHGLIAS